MENSKTPQDLPPCPREKANFVSYLSFWWVLPILYKGTRRTLDVTDLYQPLKAHKSDHIGNKLCIAWEEEIRKYAEKDKKPSLLRATMKVFGWQIMGLGIILFLKEFLLQITQPLFLGGLIAFYSGPKNDAKGREEAYYYAGAVLICVALNVIVAHPFVLSTLHSGMKLRVALCSMIYRKSLRLSKNALGETTAGQIVNLLSNDVGRLDISVIFLHYLWVGPLETIFVTYLMYREIGIAAIFGVIFLLMFIPMQGWLGKKTSVLRFRTAQRTDERVRLMNEIIQGIQVIKMYAWEKPFGKLIELARRKEVHVIRYVSYVRGILLSFILFTTRVSVFISLVAYYLLGNEVTAKQAFVITAFYNILRQTMTIFFPQGIGQLAETLVSFKRIEKYMLYDEVPSESKLSNSDTDYDGNTLTMRDKSVYSTESTLTKSIENDTLVKSSPLDFDSNISFSSHLSEPGLVLTDIKARWNTDITEYTLDDVNLRVQPETLVAIIGPVGAGKSSLIQAILGELPIESGEMKLNGTLSYASQEPWLFSSTIRQNILFGQPYEKDRYRNVIKKCALERDFTLFPEGDQTIVGERGTSLSGGQKARISLARAVYRRAAIYLLDDPLSAVDTHVGKHLFDHCMKEYLKDKMVILVTHQLQYLQNADQIVILENGKIKAVGTYESLQESGLDFAKLLSDKKSKSDDEGASETNLSRTSSQSSRKFNRAQSETSLNSVDDKNDDGPVSSSKHDEKTETGEIGWHVYNSYVKAGGGLCAFIMVALFFCLAQFLASGGDYFLSYWVNKVQRGKLESNSTTLMANNSMPHSFANADYPESFDVVNHSVYDAPKMINTFDGPQFEQQITAENFWNNTSSFIENVKNDKNLDIYIFTAITVATVVVTVGRSFHFFNFAMRASKNLHNWMFSGLIHASMYFFHTNPSGRILNRFSKDLGQVDEILPSVAIDVFQIFLALAGILVVIAIVNVWLLLPMAVISVIFYFMRVFYLRSSRNLKRMEATTRSPIYNHLSASLNGLSTIRAFHAQNILVREFDNHQDMNSAAFYLFISASRAFGYWLDLWCTIYIVIVTMSFFIMDESYGGNVGLAITQVMGMTGMVQWGMRQSAELENNMTSVERLVEYQDIEAEGELESKPDKKPPADWPKGGQIKFEKLSLRYAPDPSSDYVLKELDFEIKPKEKIGIVGRTGAGKSSLINALFRLSYNTGAISIDLRDIQDIGLHDLRSKISIIPQEPVLFSGTMRYNLDPFEEYTDEKLWSALEQVKLKEVVAELPAALETRIAEGGSNFSVGQRQLVCLARAILRENKVLVMDEATANVDPQTDSLIQMTIRNKFIDCTVLTIAHRLNTVMDSDKILVMDAGRAIEFGSPYELLTATTGPKTLRKMAKQMGKVTMDGFIKVAEEAYKNNEKDEPK